MAASRRERMVKLKWRVGLEIIQDYARELGVTLREQEYPKTLVTPRVTNHHGQWWPPSTHRLFLWELDLSGRGRGWVRNDFLASSAGEIAYNHQQREVAWVSDKENSELVSTMFHEVTHARWGHSRSPENEWSCGMISWELAWMRRLVEPRRSRATPFLSEVLDRLSADWRYYADAGCPTDNRKYRAEARARKAVKDMGLPDPWSAA